MTQTNSNFHNHIEELNDFYQEVIIEHFKRPRFKARVSDCRFCQEGKNPVCGDVISVYCKVEEQNNNNNRTLNVSFDGSGCAISQASASIMCEMIQNKSLTEAKADIARAEQIYTGQNKIDPENVEDDIEALSGISKFPARVKCAALPWKTLECLIAENFDSNGLPISSSCKTHLTALKQKKKLRIITTESK